MMETKAVELGLIAKLVIALTAIFIMVGLVLHGVSIGTFERILRNLVGRPEGPLSFRFILQPLMATFTAIIDGLKDARRFHSPFFHAVLWEPEYRLVRLADALNAIARIVLLGMVVDIIYQAIVFGRFYPTEAVIVALLLAVTPYVVLCGLITRGARKWWWRAPSNSSFEA